jgi:hypothetical protein
LSWIISRTPFASAASQRQAVAQSGAMGFWQVTASPSRSLETRPGVSTERQYPQNRILALQHSFRRNVRSFADCLCLFNQLSHAATIRTFGIRRHASTWCREKNPHPITAPLNPFTVQCSSLLRVSPRVHQVQDSIPFKRRSKRMGALAGRDCILNYPFACGRIQPFHIQHP